jgi:hypothetical protein
LISTGPYSGLAEAMDIKDRLVALLREIGTDVEIFNCCIGFFLRFFNLEMWFSPFVAQVKFLELWHVTLMQGLDADDLVVLYAMHKTRKMELLESCELYVQEILKGFRTPIVA